MTNVYKEVDKRKLKAMGDLAQENQAIRNSSATAFAFEGKWYFHPWNIEVHPRQTKDLDRVLDPSLYERAVEIIHGGGFNEALTKENIRVMLISAIDICNNVESLGDLLPHSILNIPRELVDTAERVYSLGIPLTQEQIDDFKVKHAKGIKALGILYMTEILMAKV